MESLEGSRGEGEMGRWVRGKDGDNLYREGGEGEMSRVPRGGGGGRGDG